MIVFPHLRKLIVTPPKCGSTSLNEFLSRPPYNGYVLIGPMGKIEFDQQAGLYIEAYDHHTNIIPNGLNGYQKYAVVRHPLDRVISMWSMHIKYQFSIGEQAMDVNQFLMDIGMQKHPAYFLQWNLQQCLGNVKYDGIIRLEDVDCALHRYGIIDRSVATVVPRLNITSEIRPRWQDVLRSGIVENTRDWWEPDLKYGYDDIDTFNSLLG